MKLSLTPLGVLLPFVFLSPLQGVVVVEIEVNSIQYEWDDFDEIGYHYLLGGGSGTVLPDFEVNLADHDTITLRFNAPAGQSFSWDPSDGLGGYFEGGLTAEIFYGDFEGMADSLEPVSGAVTLAGYDGIAPDFGELLSAIGDDGSYVAIGICGCIDPGQPMLFSALELTVDYSNITEVEQAGWQNQIFSGHENSVLSLDILSALTDPGSRLTLVPVPEPASAALFAGLALIGGLGLMRIRRRR